MVLLIFVNLALLWFANTPFIQARANHKRAASNYKRLGFMRADKFLWSVRLFKTRKDAAEACAENKIHIRNNAVKPGHEIKVDDEILVKHGSMRNAYLVKDFPKSRVGAKLVIDYLTEITSTEDQERNKQITDAKKESNYVGSGRPTKSDRRKLDKWNDNLFGLSDKKTRKK